MPFRSEYPVVVNRSGPRSIPVLTALFGAFLLPLLFISSTFGQISSGGSSGSGHGGGAAASSGQSFGHSGYAPSSAGGAHSSGASHSPGAPNHTSGNHPHHAASGGEYYPYLYAVPFPYAADQGDADDSSDDNDSDYQGGPTVFDRRGSGAASYIPPTYDGPVHTQNAPSGQASANESAADQAPEVPTNPTTLVFKDGHQIEVSNYAIVSQTLYDLTPGHHRRIALADLDLPATQQQNDDRGVDFQLPSLSQAN